MHICIIGDTGGIHVRSRAKAFALRGHTLSCVTPRLSADADLDEITPSGRLNTPRYLISLYRLLRDCPGDIIHLHYVNSLGAWLSLVNGDQRPIIAIVMGGDVLFDEQGDLSRLAQWMTRQVLKRADLIAAKSDHVSDTLKGMGLPKDKITRVAWGVDLKLFRPLNAQALRDEFGLVDSHLVILSSRILRPLYNHHLIAAAMPAILARQPQARLLICEYEADDSYKTEITRLAAELGVSGAVHFVGMVPQKQMPAFYSMADVCIGIPASDAFPQTVFEAMACETPVVVGRLDRYGPILRDRENSVFVDFDAESIADGILEILDDAAFAERLRQAGRDTAEAHGDLENDITRMEQESLRLLDQERGRPAPMIIRLFCVCILAGLAVRTVFSPR